MVAEEGGICPTMRGMEEGMGGQGGQPMQWNVEAVYKRLNVDRCETRERAERRGAGEHSEPSCFAEQGREEGKWRGNRRIGRALERKRIREGIRRT